MRKFLKSLILECLREAVKDQPMIISNRPPSKEDVYQIGTMWKVANNTFISKCIHVDWEQIE